jgi:hypothetical protein
MLSRRSLLQSAVALGAVGALGGLGLTGCGGGDDEAEPAPAGDGAPAPVAALLQLTDGKSTLAAGSEARFPVGLGDENGAPVKDAPERLNFDIQTEDGDKVATELMVEAHAAGLPRAYYPLAFTPPAAGIYRAVTDIGGARLETAFEVSTEDEIVIPQPGQAFPAITTPTTDEPGGVDPVCTQEPACPLHDVELSSALGSGPIALLVSTPAFCQAAICGPVLDLLLAARDGVDGVSFIHVEVFASAEEAQDEGPNASLAPAVEALQLAFEPCLFLIAADGTLLRRLDAIFDAKELADARSELAG